MQILNLTRKSLDRILQIERIKKFGLTNVKKFLKAIGNPDKELKIIHVAGTNGKGSTCAMISSVLQEAGFKVGMFTSPHLIKLKERFRINNKQITDVQLNKLTNKIKNLEKKHKINLTFFETITILAILYFKQEKVDYALLETGMGGRLDATNATKPLLSIITNIGLEHTDYLGTTIKEITKEKAGIIKPKTTLITNAKGLALKIIQKIAKKKKSNLILAENKNLEINLNGKFQKQNAKTAYTALKYLKIPEETIKKGLMKVQWPGRFEYIKKNVLLDCAHNPDGIKALLSSLDSKPIFILSIMKDKNAKSMLKKLKNHKVILTKANVKRAYDPIELKQFHKKAIITENLKQAIKEAKKTKKLIVICGSIYLIGEAYSFFNHLTPK